VVVVAGFPVIEVAVLADVPVVVIVSINAALCEFVL